MGSDDTMKIFARERSGDRRWVEVASHDDVPEGGRYIAILDGREIIVTRLAGTVCAVDAECPHRQGSLLKGRLDNGMIRCPVHGYEFDLRTGQGVGNNEILESIRVTESNAVPEGG